MKIITGMVLFGAGSGLWWQFLQFIINNEGTALKIILVGVIAALLMLMGSYIVIKTTTNQIRVQSQ